MENVLSSDLQMNFMKSKTAAMYIYVEAILSEPEEIIVVVLVLLFGQLIVLTMLI